MQDGEIKVDRLERVEEGRPVHIRRRTRPRRSPHSECLGSDSDLDASKLALGSVGVVLVDPAYLARSSEQPCCPSFPYVPSSSPSPIISAYRPPAS